MKNKGKELTGKVVGIQGKTVKVRIGHLYRHPLYRKAVRRSKLFLTHNESLTLVAGDMVVIRETKPISKRKHFVIVRKVD